MAPVLRCSSSNGTTVTVASYTIPPNAPAGTGSSNTLDTLDAPYLPIVVMEAAGLPLDPSFAEQKRVMKRCNGLFYRCAAGGEAKRFNRLLIEAGLIKRL